MRIGWAAAALIAAAAALGPAPPAQASSWNLTTLPEEAAVLYSISCPTESLCVAVGSNSTLATSTDPTAGPGAWQIGHFEDGQTHEVPPGALISGGQVRGVSCPTPQLCVAMSRTGYAFASSDPTGGPGSWSAVLLPSKKPRVHVHGLSCPSTGLCVGVALEGKVVTSTNPANPNAWKLTRLSEPLQLTGVSCPSPEFCVAVAKDGKVLSTRNPAAGASAWQVAAAGGFGELLGVSCASLQLCATGDALNIYTSSDPLGGRWSAVPDVTPLPITALSCPTNAACAAVNNNADVITSGNPTGGAGSWSFVNAIPIPPNGMFGIACPSVRFCAAVGTRGYIITSTEPFGGGDPAHLGTRKGHRRHTVRITRRPRRHIKTHRRRVRVSFRFRAIGPDHGFLCKLDRGKFRRCRSPKRYRVGPGRHAFRVKAFDPGGIAQTPTAFRFRVKRLR